MVGGDYFDFIPSGNSKLVICVADVSGKGLPASLLMANLQATLRSQTLLNPPPNKCVERSNQLLYQNTSAEKFVTLFYSVLDTEKHLLQFCNAGHTPPILFSNQKEPLRLETGGTVLGIMEDASYTEGVVELNAGDLLVMCSDGITEAIDAGEKFFGEEKLMEVIQKHRHVSALDLLETIISSVADYSESRQQADDMTLVVVKRNK